MDPIYIIIVLVLLGLALLDLIVGVANDAVNFLNSAIGSKVAPLWLILTVASAGVLLGSLFSSGMMEIARSGVFYPSKFSFNDIMLLFLAVMVTDVILLDAFNTLGLPTSTTVSLVFELLGAAVAVSLVNIWNSGDGILLDYINSGKALTIISGILVSVIIAFAVGTVIMYISRLLFSFNYKKSFLYIGAIWSAIALTAISYFAVFKGLRNTSLIDKELLDYISANLLMVLFYTWIFWSFVLAILQFVFKANILRIVILTGTAALALSFAGNDLVNFIGVFMAGLSSFEIGQAHVANGGSLSSLSMGQLSEPIAVDWRYLFGAGLIMILSLWFSKKARSVTATGVDLSRQSEGVERFSSTGASRSIVRSALSLSKIFNVITPQPVKDFIESRFQPVVNKSNDDPAFDLIRASVILTVSALLISLGTSLKLPLSTTYVTFMVAMGASLADRAWGRESAVYRISGVLTVISGWFLTAFVAFTVAAIVAFGLMYGGYYAVIGVIILVVVLSIQFMRIHKKREAKTANEKAIEIKSEAEIVHECTVEIEDSVNTIITIYEGVLKGLFNEDRKMLSKLYKTADEFHGHSKRRRLNEVLPTIQRFESQSLDTAQYYVQAMDYFYEISMSLRYITESSYQFINNAHEGFNQQQIDDLKQLGEEFLSVYRDFRQMLQKHDFSGLALIKDRRAVLLDLYSELVKKQIKRTKENESGSRNTILYLNILNETKVIAMKSVNLMRAQMNLFNTKDFNRSHD